MKTLKTTTTAQKNSRKRQPDLVYEDGKRAGVRKLRKLFTLGHFKQLFATLRGK